MACSRLSEPEPWEAEPEGQVSTALSGPSSYKEEERADEVFESVWAGDVRFEDVEKMLEDKKPSHWFIIHPETPWRVAWDVLGLAMIVADAIMTSFELSFLTAWLDGLPGPWEVVRSLVTAFFLLDILLNLVTGQLLPQHNAWVVMKLWKILLLYARSWLLLDILAAVPWEALFGEGDVGSTKAVRFGRYNKTLRLVRFMRLLRLLRLARGTSKVWSMVSGMYGRPLAREVLAIAFYMLAFLLLCHFDACFLHALQPRYLLGWDTLYGTYVASFYWACIHLLSTAPLDAPEEASLCLFSTFVAFQSLICCVAGLARVTNSVLKISERDKKLHEDLHAANDFMKAKKVHPLVEYKVRHYLRQAQQAQQSKSAIMQNLLKDSPLLYEELCMDMHGKALEALPMIREVTSDHANGEQLLRKLVAKAQVKSWPPNEMVFYRGEKAGSTIVVLEGCIRLLQVCLAENKHIARELKRCHKTEEPCCCSVDIFFWEGTWLGENSLFHLGTLQRSNSARGEVFTTGLVLEAADFNQICSRYGAGAKVAQVRRRILSDQAHQSPGCPFCKDMSHWGHQCPQVMYDEVCPEAQRRKRQLLSIADGRPRWGMARMSRRSSAMFAGPSQAHMKAWHGRSPSLKDVLADEGFTGLEDPLLAALTPEDITRTFGGRGLRASDLARLRQCCSEPPCSQGLLLPPGMPLPSEALRHLGLSELLRSVGSPVSEQPSPARSPSGRRTYSPESRSSGFVQADGGGA